MKRVDILQRIEQAGVIAVIRAQTPEQAIKTTQAVVNGGITGIELTFTVPHADQVITKLVSQYALTNAIIGAGTVLDAISARLAIMAGAQYIVSPSFDQATAELCNLYQIPYIAGCYTVTEITVAMKAGVDIVKLFPGSVGSTGMISAIKAPLPQANLMPAGGVSLETMKDWFAAGVVAVNVGHALIGPADDNNFTEVTDRAKKYVAEFKSIKAK
jgi:2-dehydro-3-deoxyphosphogluconate aldolase/(4S)-4-hydroxy-2-oxoglutarate aldolase